MKKIIRFLSDISGVSNDIRRESAVEIGNSMEEYAYWFNGGIMHNKSLKQVCNILYLYPKACLKNGDFHLYGSQFSDLRREIYKMNELNKYVFDKETIENRKTLYKDKIEQAKRLKDDGYSIREIMRIMDYKSPRSVQNLLNTKSTTK